MANKRRNKDSVNNGDDDDVNTNIKINIKGILDNDLVTPEYLEELSKKFFKLADAIKSKDNEDDSQSSEDDSCNNNGNNNDNNNGNNNDYENNYDKKRQKFLIIYLKK